VDDTWPTYIAANGPELMTYVDSFKGCIFDKIAQSHKSETEIKVSLRSEMYLESLIKLVSQKLQLTKQGTQKGVRNL
jgi:hypothetical protein